MLLLWLARYSVIKARSVGHLICLASSAGGGGSRVPPLMMKSPRSTPSGHLSKPVFSR